MRPFHFIRADDAKAALIAQMDNGSNGEAVSYLAGGTTLLDLMKLDVMRPSHLIDINGLEAASPGRIDFGPKGLRLGAMVRMSRSR